MNFTLQFHNRPVGEILQKSIIQYQSCCINYFLETDDGNDSKTNKKLLNSSETKNSPVIDLTQLKIFAFYTI